MDGARCGRQNRSEPEFPYIARTKKEAKEQIDREIGRREFAASMYAELRVEISECGLELGDIEEAVRRAHGEDWKYSRTEMAFDTCIMAVFERV